MEKFAEFANSVKNIYFCQRKHYRIDIKFEKEYLSELYYNGKTTDRKHWFQPQIVKKYVRVVNVLESVDSTEDLYRYVSLHYERLTGDKAG